LSLICFCSLVSLNNSVQASPSEQTEINNLANITNIKEDEKGYIWLSGQQGLSRFDGNEIINFSSNNKTWPLPFQWINDINFYDDNILISSETDGVWEFTPKTGEINKVNFSLKNNGIYDAVYFDNNYYAYGFTDNILYTYSSVTNQTKILKEDIKIRDFLPTKEQLFFSSSNGVYKLLNDKKVEKVFSQYVEASASNQYGVFFSTKNSLSFIDNSNALTSISIKSAITSLTSASDEKSIFSVDRQNRITQYSLPELNEIPHTYPQVDTGYTRNLLHDNSGTLWKVGSKGTHQLIENEIQNHTLIYDSYFNKISSAVLNNKLVIGTHGEGLDNFDKSNIIIPLKINDSLSEQAKIIITLLAVNNQLYLATFDGVWRYDPQLGTLEKLNFPNNNAIILNLSHKNDQLFISSDNQGAMIYDLKQERITQKIDATYQLSSLEVIDMLPFNNGDIWLATEKGIDIYYPKSNVVKNISVPGPNKVISLLFVDNKVFAATKGDGILVYNTEGVLLSVFSKGIDFKSITFIKDQIWAPSKSGLFIIDPVTYQTSMIPNTEQYAFVNYPTLFKNKLYFGHQKGILAVPLTPTSQYHSPIHISKTTVSGKSYLQNKVININSSNEVITLSLASLDYRQGRKKQFKYQINSGIWNDVYGNQLTLTGLKSGSYYLTIMGTNSMGQWSDFQAFTRINVAFPWYWTPKLRVVYVVITLGMFLLTLWLLYLRGKSISYIHDLLSSEAKIKSKTTLTISRNLSHAITLCTSANDTNFEEKDKVKAILQQSINELKTQIQHKEPDGLYGKELKVAVPYFIEYLHKKYHVNISHQIDIHEESISYELKADLYKITYEAFTSAILNGDGSHFSLSLKQHNEKIWLTINDDAGSFSHFKNKISFDMAMYYIRQIANKYNASVNTFDDQEQGSQLVISIPLMKLS